MKSIIDNSMMALLKNKTQLAVTATFLGFVIWWATFQHVVAKQGISVQWWGGTYGVIALIGSIIAFIASARWGGLKTVLGKSFFFFGLSLLGQEAGQLIYTYYIYVDKIQIPYPSLGDIAYFGSVLLYIVAAFFLAKAMGVSLAIKNNWYKFLAALIPIAITVVSYVILLHGHQYDTAKPLTVFLDAGYPIGEAIYISIGVVAYILSAKMLGGVLRPAILLVLFALLLQYTSDFHFVYESYRGTYLAGQFADLNYLIAYYAMSIAMINFSVIYKNLKLKAGKAEPDNG